MRVTRYLCLVYFAACLAAMALTSKAGWIADALGFPWSLLAAQVANPGFFGHVVLVAAAMALNLAIIFAVGRWLARHR